MQDELFFILILLILLAIPNIAAWLWVFMDWRKKKGKYRVEVILPNNYKQIGYYTGKDGRLDIYEGGKKKGDKGFNPEFSTTCFKEEKYFLGFRKRKVLEVVWGADRCIDFNSLEKDAEGKLITPVPRYSRNTIKGWLRKEMFDIWPKPKTPPNTVIWITLIFVVIIALKVLGVF